MESRCGAVPSRTSGRRAQGALLHDVVASARREQLTAIQRNGLCLEDAEGVCPQRGRAPGKTWVAPGTACAGERQVRVEGPVLGFEAERLN